MCFICAERQHTNSFQMIFLLCLAILKSWCFSLTTLTAQVHWFQGIICSPSNYSVSIQSDCYWMLQMCYLEIAWFFSLISPAVYLHYISQACVRTQESETDIRLALKSLSTSQMLPSFRLKLCDCWSPDLFWRSTFVWLALRELCVCTKDTRASTGHVAVIFYTEFMQI